MVIDYSRIKRDSAYHIFSPYRTIAEGKGYSVNRGHAEGIRKSVILLNSKNKVILGFFACFICQFNSILF